MTHKSPDVGGDPPPKRLILKVDLNEVRPQLEWDDDESDEEEGGRGGEGGYTEGRESVSDDDDDDDDDDDNDGQRAAAALKRLVTSDGFKSAKTWKVRRT